MYRLQSEEGSHSKAAMLLWGEKLQWLVIRELACLALDKPHFER